MPNMNFTKQQIDQIGRIAGLASKLQDRCDAFLTRRAKRDAEKAQRRADKARRDAERPDPGEQAQIASDPFAPPIKPDNFLNVPPFGPPAWFSDEEVERTELRQGALSKGVR